MTRTQKFYMCKDCCNIVGVINNTGIPLHCCNKEMKELQPNVINSERDKNRNDKSAIFRAEQNNNNNSVSIIVDKSYLNPNSICWAYLNTEKGGQRKNLFKDDAPVLNFHVIDDKPVSAYFYCSNHGLFKWEF